MRFATISPSGGSSGPARRSDSAQHFRGVLGQHGIHRHLASHLESGRRAQPGQDVQMPEKIPFRLIPDGSGMDACRRGMMRIWYGRWEAKGATATNLSLEEMRREPSNPSHRGPEP